jgi:hypothetical protein
MSIFPGWEKYAVRQKRPESGCIPTGYEMLLRAAEVENISFDSFQDEFDLDKDRKPGEIPKNNFLSVADVIHAKYPSIIINIKTFPSGEEKLSFIEDCLSNHRLVLISLSLVPFGFKDWHIMPVVDANQENLLLLNGVNKNGEMDLKSIRKGDIVYIHNNYPGGNDVAYLESF